MNKVNEFANDLINGYKIGLYSNKEFKLNQKSDDEKLELLNYSIEQIGSLLEIEKIDDCPNDYKAFNEDERAKVRELVYDGIKSVIFEDR